MSFNPYVALDEVIAQADADGEIVNVSILVLHKDGTSVAYSCSENGQVVTLVVSDGGEAILSGVMNGSLNTIVSEPGL